MPRPDIGSKPEALIAMKYSAMQSDLIDRGFAVSIVSKLTEIAESAKNCEEWIRKMGKPDRDISVPEEDQIALNEKRIPAPRRILMYHAAFFPSHLQFQVSEHIDGSLSYSIGRVSEVNGNSERQ